MINRQKTTQDILQEEILRERVAALTRSADHLTAVLTKMEKLDTEIAAAMKRHAKGKDALKKLNRKISEFNELRLEA
ncbi:MAG: hypothetical protein PHY31_03730, partial [Smithellaceae bacterium]|nr:hypothetical protein [Smithellaceae bacterium]